MAFAASVWPSDGQPCVGAADRHGYFWWIGAGFYDLGSSRNPHQPSDSIALIAINDPSIASLGPLPWPRDIHAKLIDTLAAAKPKVVVDTVPFFASQPDRGLVFIQQMKAALAQAPLGP